MLALVVKGEAINFQTAKGGNVVSWMLDHKVTIEVGFGEVSSKRFDDWRADGEIGDEVPE